MKRKADKDAAERQAQREEVEKKRRLEMYGKAGGAGRVVGGIVNIKEIKDSWGGVLQKASENKINVKNAWSVNQFESLPVLAKQLGADGDFHTSGVAIESAAKVFSYKVDALLLQSSKVQTAITKGEEAKPEVPEGDESTTQQPKEKAKRRRVLTTTIAAPDEINLNKTERTALVDPLFARTSSRFDQGGANGLLLMNCPFGKFLNVQIDSNTVEMGATVDDTEPPLEVGEVDLSVLEEIQDDGKQKEEVPKVAETSETAAEAPPMQESEVLMEVPPSSPLAEVALPDAANEVDSDDGGGGGEGYEMPDMLIDDGPVITVQEEVPLFNADKEEQKEVEERLQNMEKKADIKVFKDSYLVASTLNLAPEGEAEILEMHQTKQVGAWQGPFDTNRWRMVRQTQHTATETQRKKKQASEGIVMEMTDEVREKLTPAKSTVAQLLPRGKDRLKWEERKEDEAFIENYVNAEVSMKHARSNKILLPDDHLVTTEAFFKLNCLPHWNMVHKKQVYQDGTEADHPVLKADQTVGVSEELTQVIATPPREAEDTGNEEWGEWGADDDVDMNDEEPLFNTLNTMSTLQETPVLMELPQGEGQEEQREDEEKPPELPTDIDIVERPKEVQTLNIDYAKKAKVVDIKKLKDTMWKCMTRRKGRDGKIESTLFSTLINGMQSIVKEMKIAAHVHEISISLYFISLLHLCNDHNLQVTQTSDKMDDLLIEAR